MDNSKQKIFVIWISIIFIHNNNDIKMDNKYN